MSRKEDEKAEAHAARSGMSRRIRVFDDAGDREQDATPDWEIDEWWEAMERECARRRAEGAIVRPLVSL